MKTKLGLLIFSICWCALTAFGQQHSLSGKITDEGFVAITGATIHLLNTEFAAISNKEGRFEIKNLPAGKYTVEISAVGFATINKTITTQENNLQITMRPASLQLDEVVVSAEKKEEKLQALPYSISALSSKKIEEYRLWNTKDLTTVIPNLYTGNPGDDRNVTSLRGITSTSYDPAVATYVDGVNQFSLDTYIPQLFDVERIEILRGPQGTLYGRNAMGGVINIITKKPRNYLTGFAEASIGDYGRQRYTAGVRLPIIANKLFAGFAGMYNGFNGFYKNELNKTHFDKQHAITGNYYLTYLATDRLSFSLNAKHNNNRNNGPFTLVNGISDAFDNPYKVMQNATSKMIDNTFNTSLTAKYTGKLVDFTSQTGWQANHRYYKQPLDGDFSPIDGVTIINNYGNKWNNVKVFTQEFRLSSSVYKTSPLSWTGGIYLFHQNVPNKQATHFGEDAAWISPDAPVNTSLISTSTGKNTGAAFFGQATYAVTSKLSITAGLRYDYEKKKLSVLGEYQPDGSPTPIFETQPDTSSTANFNAFSPKLNIAYTIAENSNAYFAFSRGFRAGGLTQLSSDPSTPPLHPYNPEYSNNFEVGIKNEFWNKRLRINANIFFANITNAQVPTLILPDGIIITKNAGLLESKGFELEAAAKPAKGLSIDYNFGYTDAKYKTLKLADDGGEVNFAGKRQLFTPTTTSSLATQYAFSLDKKASRQIVARVEWMNLGKHYFDLANAIEQKGYSLLNARLGLTTKYGDLILWMRNVTDERFISYAYDFGAVQLGPPRTIGATISIRF